MLSDDDIEDFISLLHWIPATKGHLREWMREKAPTMSSAGLAAKLVEEGRMRPTGQAFPAFSLVRGVLPDSNQDS